MSGELKAVHVVPAHVLARGDKAVQAYYRALENGKTYDKRVKVFFIGQDRVGKTSVIRSLRGEQFNEGERSTEGVHMHRPLKNVDENAWKNGDVLQHTTVYDHKCAEIMSKVLSAKAKEQPTVEEFAISRRQTEEEEKDKKEEHEKLPEKVHQTLTANVGVIKRSDREKEGIPEVIASLTEEKLKGDESDKDEGIWPVIWDFAGQAVYHAIHPIFLSPEAVYVLVFDITKNLSDTAQCHVMLHGKKELVPSPNSEDTNLDHIMRWMDMVHSLEHSVDQEKTPESLPPVILVGTHADGVDGDPWTEMDTLLDTFCDNNEVYSKHIVEGTFVVDNTLSGTDPQIEDLRLKILNVAGVMPHTKMKFPLQWLHIEKEIYDSANHGMKYVKKREFAEKFYNSEKDDYLDELLNFLHVRGTIIYHDCDSSPDCLIVLDPQWLINVLCQIIEPAAPRRNETSSKRKQRRDLATKGILAEELLHDAFKNLKLDHIQRSLLAIMVEFNLICNWRNQNGRTDYLVPCMLAAQPPSNKGSGTTSRESASVYLTFSTNYVPSGLFSRLVVLIGRWVSSRSPCKQPELFAKTACFFIGEHHCLCLACYKSVIKLHVQDSTHDSSDPLEGEPRLCLEILSCLTESLENLRTDCHWLQSMSWELCAQCDLCPGKVNPVTKNCFWHKKQGCPHEDCAHYIPLNSSPFCCPDAPGPDRPLWKEKFKPWTKALTIIESPAVIPAYVLARGDKAVQAYHRALKNGKTYDKRVKVFFIGQDGVGKTSLVRSLRGEQFKEMLESTEGVQMHKPLKNVDVNAWKNKDVLQQTTVFDHKCSEILSKDLSAKAAEQQKDKESAISRGQTEKEEEDEEEHKTLPEELNQTLTAEIGVKKRSAEQQMIEESATSRRQTEKEEEDEEEHETLPEELNQTLTAEIGVKKRSDEKRESIPEVIASLTQEKLEGDESDNDEGIWPVIWDFAGQAVYHAIHPIFLSREAVYVLVFDITKNFSDTAQCHVMRYGKKELVPSPYREDTNLDHVMRWMDMVHSLEHSIDQEKTPESLPPVILVGTHADRVDGDPWTEMDTLLDTFCDNNEVYSKHIVADKFVVDNTLSGTDRQIEELRLKVLNVAGMMPHTKEEIPLQWLHIEKEIYDSANHGMKYVKKLEFAEKFYNSEKDDDLGEVLYFLHARGTIIYHDCDSSPDCLVVLDPQWLINVLCQIIEPAAPRRNETSSKRKQRRDLATKGILAEELLHDAFKNLKLDHIQGSLLSIMEKFNLICNWRNRNGMTDYLVPCMLTAQPPSNEADSASVYLTFSTNYVPSGLFSRLVVLIGRWASSSCSSRQPQLFARTACFFIGEDHCLCLVCFRSVIKLQVSRHDSSDPLEGKPGLCLQICSCLTESLENLRTDCHWLQSMSWELCAHCDLCPGKENVLTKNCFWHKKQGCSHEDCAHYIPVNSSPFCCPDAPGSDRPLCKEKFKHWTKALKIIECRQNPDSIPDSPTWAILRETLPSIEELCTKLVEIGRPDLESLICDWLSSQTGIHVWPRRDKAQQPYDTALEDASDPLSKPKALLLEESLLKRDRKTNILRGKVKEEGDFWELTEAAAFIKFPPKALTEPMEIICSLWSHRTCSPPLDENEALVSNVIELSRDGPPSLELSRDFNEGVTLALSHSATDLEGYEVVIQQLMDSENNEWKDLETKNTWRASGIQGDPPLAEAKVTQCSSFAVVWRLKSFTFSSNTTSVADPVFTCIVPEYPDVSVAIPRSDLPESGDFSLTIKVQEVPCDEGKDDGVLVGPILHISSSPDVRSFKEPVTIKIPFTLREAKKEVLDLSSDGQLRILFFNCGAKYPEWTEITDELETPSNLKDGVVTFKVKRFSRYTVVKDSKREREPSSSDLQHFPKRLKMPQEAGFLACLRETIPSGTLMLTLCCYPLQMKDRVNRSVSSKPNMLGQVHKIGFEGMCVGDKAFVSHMEHMEPSRDEHKENFFLRFLGDVPFERDMPVIVEGEGVPRVELVTRHEEQEQREARVMCELFLEFQALEISENSQNPAGSFVTPTDLSKVRSDLHPGSERVYKMTANPRGLVLIINIRTFDSRVRIFERRGSEKDVESVQELFEGLQFEVHTETDLTGNGILRVLSEFGLKNHSSFDCFVVWLMSHGNNGEIQGTDGETVPIEAARNFFSSARCESLKGKPKLFFIQACRGGRKDEIGVVTEGPDDEAGSVPAQSRRPDETRPIPDQADFMFAYASPPKHVAYLSEEGSTYVRCLVEVFQERAGYEHLGEMLTEVVNRVSQIYLTAQSGNRYMLCPHNESSLRKPLFFWPGL